MKMNFKGLVSLHTEIQAFINEVIPDEAEEKAVDEEFIDVVIPAEDYF